MISETEALSNHCNKQLCDSFVTSFTFGCAGYLTPSKEVWKKRKEHLKGRGSALLRIVVLLGAHKQCQLQVSCEFPSACYEKMTTHSLGCIKKLHFIQP